MTEYEKREECISNLIHQIGWIEDIDSHKFPGRGHTVNAMRQAMHLLKAQEPRVLTLAELEHAEVAYAEDIDKDEIIPILVNGRQHDRFNMVRARLGNNPSRVFYPSIFDYNKRWRCWTSKPTKEQRQETKWA